MKLMTRVASSNDDMSEMFTDVSTVEPLYGVYSYTVVKSREI